MAETRRAYAGYEPVDEEPTLGFQDFDKAIQTLKNYQEKLPEAQKRYKAQLENKIGQVNKTGILREIPSAVELIAALEKLRDKIVKDVNEEGFPRVKALEIARSAYILTFVLTDPRNDLDTDKKCQAVQKFQGVVEDCPITPSNTRVALSMLVGAVVGAAVVFLLVFAPYLMLGAAFLPLMKCAGGVAILSAGGLTGITLGEVAAYRNPEIDNFVNKAEKFVSKPGFFSSMRGLFFSSSSQEKQQTGQQLARSSTESEPEDRTLRFQPSYG